MPGGEPFGVLLVDHEVRHRRTREAPTDDVAAIAALSSVAAAAFAIVVLPASPALLDVDEFADLAMASDPASPLRQPLHERWRNLAARDDMRFVCFVLPRVLARPPWSTTRRERTGSAMPSMRRRWHSVSGCQPLMRSPRWSPGPSPIMPGRQIFAASTRTARAAASSPTCRWRIFKPIRPGCGLARRSIWCCTTDRNGCWWRRG